MLNELLIKIPKVELHVHIEGTLEPELMFKLAKKNNVNLPYEDINAVKNAYKFHDLQSFLDIYYQGMNVLLKQDDFYELTLNYLKKAHKQNVKHVEIFFDPQAHLSRGISFDTVITGIEKALEDGKKQFNISSKIIMCFLRDLSEESAFEVLKLAMPYKDKIIAVGLCSSEIGHPASKFQRVFKQATNKGFLSVAHLGEECEPKYIWEGIKLLNLSRIDHGVQAIHDKSLINYLAKMQIPLTVCPLANIKLCVFENMGLHPIKHLLDQNVCVTVNSDDPAYFGGYMLENYQSISESLNLSKNDIFKLAYNGINASFLSPEEKQVLSEELLEVVK